MGLLQQAYNTYQAHNSEIGKIIENTEPLAPISHMVTRAQIEITINGEGKFISASALGKKSDKIIIPVTEESAGRTSTSIHPHPLDEQLGYLVPGNTQKMKAYLEQLHKWCNSEYANVKLEPIFRYVSNGTIVDDLDKSRIIKWEKGKIKNEKDLVRWVVIGIGDSSGPCWTDTSLFADHIKHYKRIKLDEKQVLCMISGERMSPAKQHPKGTVALYANAKLISANDKKNGFTFRGRFEHDWEAATVGYEVSQKVHNALRWLVANQGINLGGRTFLCWNPEGIKVPAVHQPLLKFQNNVEKVKHVNYQKELYKTLIGWKEQLSKNVSSMTVIAAFDGTSDKAGRLSITYYNELLISDFLERLYIWDKHCQWFFTYRNIQESPSLKQIVECAFGVEREEKGNTFLAVDDKIVKQQAQRLLACRIDCARFPLDIEQRLVQRASNPQAYDDPKIFGRVLSTACAVIKKVYFDYGKGEIEMALDPQKKDRSYQFGRLLAVMEKIEADTYTAVDDRRVTNAMRLQSVFCREPMKYAMLLDEQMNKAYLPKLKPSSRGFYKTILGQIFEMINEEPEKDWNKPLAETYLIGYYLQRNALYTKNNKEE